MVGSFCLRGGGGGEWRERGGGEWNGEGEHKVSISFTNIELIYTYVVYA